MSRSARRMQQARYKSPIPGGSTITHGDQIKLSNVGYTAYYDNSLGRNLVLSDLQVMGGVHYVSDYISSGGTMYKKRFTGDVLIDIDNVSFVGCLFDNPIGNLVNGYYAKGWKLDYCSIDPLTTGDQGIYYNGYTATRCLFRGSSDGAKANGGNSTFIECYIRTKAESTEDHNDAIQNVGGNGPVNVIRCNIDANPPNGADFGYSIGNSALFLANGEVGLHTISDNLLCGGNYTIAMYDTGTFNVQGNKFVRGSYNFGTHAIAGPGSGPQNVTWGTVRPNTFSDNGQVIPL